MISARLGDKKQTRRQSMAEMVFSWGVSELKYLLTTCSGTKETKYGRRVSGLFVKSMCGRIAKLPDLVECEHVPQDKSEIPTPTTTKHYPHLEEVSKEIPPLDQEAKIGMLIGRDAPELLKVRAFKNGPKGAPWAQKLALGWTVSGQMCHDRVGGPVHISARSTVIQLPPPTLVIEPRIQHEEGAHANLETHPGFRTVTCPNYFEVKDEIKEHSEKTKSDVYRTTPEDNEIGLSWIDRQFLHIMEKGIHKNESGNWEMPLPFRSPNVTMPNNREQAMNRLQSLLRTFKRKPQMEKDYLEFLGKVIKRGHAVPVRRLYRTRRQIHKPGGESKCQAQQSMVPPAFRNLSSQKAGPDYKIR